MQQEILKSETESPYLHWRLEWDHDNILWLYFNRADSSTNVLNRAALDEFEVILDGLSENNKIQGLVIVSGKSNGFIYGADLKEFPTIDTPEKARAVVERGQHIFDKLEKLNLPTVALIDGLCLGGGLELALACHHRIASDDMTTKLGLPEVTLGVHPGWGGTVRLPRLIGPLQALDLILTGKTILAKQAYRLGLIDEVVPQRHLKSAARTLVLNPRHPHQPSLWQSLGNQRWARFFLAKALRKMVPKRANREHYGAPFAVIDNWAQYSVHSEIAMQKERESFSQLMLTDTSKNLVRIFSLKEHLKSFGKQVEFHPQRIHVVGAGVMGGDIALWCALHGFRVTLFDQEISSIAQAMKRADQFLSHKLKKSKREVQAIFDNLIPDIKGEGVAESDVIIEAIVEKAEIKQAVFEKLESVAKPNAILATNTSSIALNVIAESLKNPERLIGIHFFNPVYKMPLIEVVFDERTSPDIINKTANLVLQWGKLPLPVKSKPGFLVNRVLMPYLLEAFELLEEGYAPQDVDFAAEAFGMPMGPIELADGVGLDVCLYVSLHLIAHYAVEKGAADKHSQRIKKMVDGGYLGKKSNKGFYIYKQGKCVKPRHQIGPLLANQLGERMVLRLLNEVVACQREGLVPDDDCLDAGLIFGAGFAPFRGGPLQYAKQYGTEKLYKRFQVLCAQYGQRFKPDDYWNP